MVMPVKKIDILVVIEGDEFEVSQWFAPNQSPHQAGVASFKSHDSGNDQRHAGNASDICRLIKEDDAQDHGSNRPRRQPRHCRQFQPVKTSLPRPAATR